MARRYRGFSPASIRDSNLRDILSTIDLWIRDADAAIAKASPSNVNTAGTSAPPSGGGGDVPLGTFSRGDLAVGLGPPTNGLTRLPIGLNRQVLQSNATDPQWSDLRPAQIIFIDVSQPSSDIQAAIDSLVSGGIVWLSPGIFEVATKLILRNGVTLRGSGREATYIHCLDYDVDILSIQTSNVSIEDLTIYHGTTTGNGYGGVGSGRGIVVEAPGDPLAGANIKGPFIRRCGVFNTSSWGIYDTGAYSPDDISYGDGFASAGLFANTAEHPFPIWGYTSTVLTTFTASSVTTIDSRTVTSTGAFASVRVGQIVTGTGIPHNTRVTAKASNSSITISNKATETSGSVILTFKHTTDCGITVGMIIEDCNIGFANSGGAIFLGYAGTTSHLANIKTNCYSFGSYASHNDATPGNAVTQGAIHYYGRSGETQVGCVLQTPSAQLGGEPVPHADTDGTMLSFHATHTVGVYRLYTEVLSAYCRDGVDWRIGADGRLDNDSNGYRQYWIITTSSTDIAFEEPSFFCATTNFGDTTDGYPARILRSFGGDGGCGFRMLGGRISHKRKVYTSGAPAPFTSGAYYPIPEFGNSTTRPWDDDDFLLEGNVDGDIGHPILIEDLHVVNIQGAVREPTVNNTTSISSRLAFRMRNNDRNVSFGKWEDVDRAGTSSGGAATMNDLATRRGLVGPILKRGEFGYVAGTPFINVLIQKHGNTTLDAPNGDLTNFVVGMPVAGNGIQPNSYVTNVAGIPNSVTINNAATDSNLETITFTSIGASHREGLWGYCSRENNWRQIPWIRQHTSSWSITRAGDMWMRLNGAVTNGTYPNAEFNWYSNAAWNAIFGLPRTTTAAGDLAYYSATDTPARLPIGSTDNLLTVAAGAPSWAAPDFKDSLFRVSDNGDTTKKAALECSGITTGTTRTLTVPNASGTLALIDLAQTWGALQTIKDTQLNIVDDGDTTKKLAFECSGLTTGVTRTLKIPDESSSIVVVGNTTAASGTLGSISLTGQTGNLAAQTLLTGNANTAGVYRVSLYLKCTTAGTGSAQVSVDLTWNDGTAHTDTILLTYLDGSGSIGQGNLSLLAVNKAAFGHDVIKVAASQNVTFTSTVVTTGNPQYAIEARIEALG